MDVTNFDFIHIFNVSENLNKSVCLHFNDHQNCLCHLIRRHTNLYKSLCLHFNDHRNCSCHLLRKHTVSYEFSRSLNIAIKRTE